MPSQKIDGKWYSDELGRYFDPSKETSTGYSVTVPASIPLTHEQITQSNAQLNKRLESETANKLKILQQRVMAGDNSPYGALGTLREILNMGNVPQQLMNPFLQQIQLQNNQRMLKEYLSSAGNRGSNYLTIEQQILKDAPQNVLNMMTPQQISQQRQIELNAARQQAKDIAWEENRKANSGGGNFFSEFISPYTGKLISAATGIPFVETAFNALYNTATKPDKPNFQPIIDFYNQQRENISNRYQPSQNPRGMMTWNNNPLRQSNPFAGFNQQPMNNPFTPQQPLSIRPQQPANQGWLNMIGR